MRRALLLSVVVLTAACSGFKDDPILQLSSVEALEQGKQLLEEEKYRQARPFLIHAFEIEPNSVQGREGLLLTADALYNMGGASNLLKAQSRYRDFLNRFPTSDRAAYAQFQMGMSLSRRMEKPDRDQSLSTEALEAFNDVRRLFPTSEYAVAAAAEIDRVRTHMARHEVMVARFYLRFKRFGTAPAAIERLEELVEEFPSYPEMDEALYYICKGYSLGRTAELARKAQAACDRLAADHPTSKFVKKMPKIPKIDEVEADAEEVDTAVPADGGL